MRAGRRARTSSFGGRERRIATPGTEYCPSGGLASSQAVVVSDFGDLFYDETKTLSCPISLALLRGVQLGRHPFDDDLKTGSPFLKLIHWAPGGRGSAKSVQGGGWVSSLMARRGRLVRPCAGPAPQTTRPRICRRPWTRSAESSWHSGGWPTSPTRSRPCPSCSPPLDLDGALITADATAHPQEHRRVDHLPGRPLAC